LLALLLSLTACNRSGDSTALLDRTAVLPFENLSGDPALDRWKVPLQQAFQTMSGARLALPTKETALLSGAPFLTQATMERGSTPDRLRLTLQVFDVATHKVVRAESAEDADPFRAIQTLAKAIEPKSTGLGNKTPETLLLWTDLLNAESASELIERCRKLLEIEPGFSPAYISCSAAPFARREARSVAELGYANRMTLNPRAKLLVGQALSQNGKHKEAIDLMTSIAAANPDAWNTIGYSYASLGDIEAAKKAFAEYRKLGGDEPNAVDSLGEAHYIIGKYPEAEKYFLECAEKFPQTQQGRTGKLKAAAMRALGGNRGGAEELARSLIDTMRKAGQPTSGFEELWRGIILEQNPAEMRKKIEAAGIINPPPPSPVE
jgi:tetratricopeptide (TPR) repeat protein